MEGQEDQNKATKWQKNSNSTEETPVPTGSRSIGSIVFALFATLVKYDESGTPHNSNPASISNGSMDRSDRSEVRQDGGAGISLSTNMTKLYPCKCR